MSKITATRSRPKNFPSADSKQLLIEMCDADNGLLVWEDGTHSTYQPESKLGIKLSADLRKAKTLPKKVLTVKAVAVSRKWGWHNGRWTVIGFK